MKQRKVVSLIGALVLLITAVVLITGCSQPNSNKGNTGNNGENTGNNGGNTGNNGGTTSNNGGTTGGNTGNNGGSLAVQPTAEADSELKDTEWSSNDSGTPIHFATNGNIANMSGDQALYTIKGEMISFDLSSSIANAENMTEAKLIQERKITMREEIPYLEKEIKEAQEKGDEQKKKELEESLERAKKWLNALENPDAKVKEEIKQSLKDIHEYASKMKAYAKFEGIFNSEKTKLTIEKFPHYDWRTKEVTVKKIVFEKNT